MTENSFGGPSSLAEGLSAVLGKVKPSDAKKAYESILSALAKTNDTLVILLLSEALRAVPGKLEREDAQKAYDWIVTRLAEETDPDALKSLSMALKAVPGEIALATLVNLAKYPTCVGKFRTAVLEIIERQNQPAKFGGDIWRMVEWAEKNHPELDLKSPPRRPVTP
jgi:hypothetical protein